jgi:hypothetical protein
MQFNKCALVQTAQFALCEFPGCDRLPDSLNAGDIARQCGTHGRQQSPLTLSIFARVPKLTPGEVQNVAGVKTGFKSSVEVAGRKVSFWVYG